MKCNNGFSLIELSIVLIIIGLLVAGITGGNSLVFSARVRTIINEFRLYEQAVYAFKAANNRLPGDLNNKGFFPVTQLYTDASFGAPYVTGNLTYGLPDEISGVFVDMYLKKVIDYEPKKYKSGTGGLLWYNGGTPKSKSGLGIIFFYNATSAFINSLTDSNHALYNTKPGTYIRWAGTYSASDLKYTDYSPKYHLSIDQKLDDGVYNSGIVRGQCLAANDANEYLVSYSNAKLCRASWLYFDI